MEQPHKTDTTSLPENAYGELAPGETYRPVMPDTPAPREVRSEEHTSELQSLV